MTQIRALRLKMGLGLVAACHEAKVHPATLSAVEQKKQKASKRTREVISSFLGIAQAEAFDAEGFAV